MDEFKDFSLNEIPGLTGPPAPTIGGSGDQILDLDEDVAAIASGQDWPRTNSRNETTPVSDEASKLILGPVRRPAPITVGPVDLSFAVQRYYMDIRDGYRITSRGRLFVEGAHLRYQQLYNWLKKHATLRGEIDLFQVTDGWLKDFIHFLHHQDLSVNTVSGYIDNLHAFINNLITDGVPLRSMTIRVAPEVAEAVFNPEEELKKMLDTTFSHDALTIVRDIFVMHSYLGFRVGTLQCFLRNPQQYLFERKGKWFVRIRTNKTGFIVTVPVKDIVLDILTRRNFNFEREYYERYYNPLIKMMAREAGITELVPYTITYGNKRKEFLEPKCDLMASHTARRNLATNGYLAGIFVDLLMWITGHTTREAFLGYVRADSWANAFIMADQPFFR